MQNDIFDNELRVLPLLPLRGLHVFPGMLLTFDVERSASIAALNAALKADQLIFLATQKDLSTDIPQESDIFHVGTVCRIRQQLHLPRGSMSRVMVEGLFRARAESISAEGGRFSASLVPLPDKIEKVGAARKEALIRSCIGLFQEYISYSPDMVNEQMLNLLANPEASYVSYYIAQNVRLGVEDRQRILEELSPSRRLAIIARLLNTELNVLSIEKELTDATQEAMNRSQREYYLKEELKIIQSELGEDDDVNGYRDRIEALPVADDIKEKLNKDLARLAKQPFGSSEASVIQGYLDTCLEIPWNVRSRPEKCWTRTTSGWKRSRSVYWSIWR